MKKLPITFKVGTRKSPLALIQTDQAIEQISNLIKGLDFQIYHYESPGDRDKNINLKDSPSDFFTKDLDEALKKGKIDFAVHSAKDISYTFSDEIDWFWLPKCQDPRDAIVLQKKKKLDSLSSKPIIGISSDRREKYCKAFFPNAIQKSIRGNIEERLFQLDNKMFDMLILASAGLNRLGLQKRITKTIPLDHLPTPDGQGYLAISFHKNNDRLKAIRNIFVPSITFAGAGIGMHDDCSIGAIEEIRECDVCLYDSLMSHRLLSQLKSSGKAINVGKRCGAHSKEQYLINSMICDYARKGLKVVRLKGGDPGIFGRLAEEVGEIENLGLAYRVIPGITAMQAATTGTGMLLTRRDISRGFVVLTPRVSGGKLASCNKEIKAKLPVIYYMAIKVIPHIMEELINDGWSKDTPASIIYNAGDIEENIIQSTINDLPKDVHDSDESKPGILIVGDISSYRYNQQLGSLAGKKILLTCSEILQSKAKSSVYNYGGRPICLPLIKLSPKKELEYNCIDYDWIIITSPSSARAFLEYINFKNIDVRQIPSIMVCGKGTAEIFKRNNILVDAQPAKEFGADSIQEIAKKKLTPNDRVLRLRSDIAGVDLSKKLKNMCNHIDDAIIYENSPILYDNLPTFDAIFFSSPSCVNNYLAQWGKKILVKKTIVVIGSSTAKTLLKNNIKPNVVAKEATAQSAIESLACYYTKLKLIDFNNL